MIKINSINYTYRSWVVGICCKKHIINFGEQRVITYNFLHKIKRQVFPELFVYAEKDEIFNYYKKYHLSKNV